MQELILFGYGWKTGSNGGMTYYALLNAYVYHQSVPEFNLLPMVLFAMLLIAIARRK